jgi:RNA polymerase sigma-70 factor, ECF subfamily
MHENALIKKVLRGDAAAAERLVTQHYARIYHLLRCLTGSVETAEDLTQQTFMRAWQSLAGYQGRASFATWLHRIAYHEYTHWLRARRDHLPLEAAIDIADVKAAYGLDSILVSRALMHLPTELREVFLLYYLQQLSVAEVAAVLDVPPGTVKSRLFTARKQMRALWQAAEAPATPTVEEAPARLFVSSYNEAR